MQSNRNRKSERWSGKDHTTINLGVGLAKEGKKLYWLTQIHRGI